jgi:hypothetical protein
VTEIGDCAFARSEKLTHVVLGERVKTIKYRAFERCSALTSIILNKQIATIGDEAFAYCSSLNSIQLPSTIKKIHKRTFYESALHQIHVAKEKKEYFCKNGLENWRNIIYEMNDN